MSWFSKLPPPPPLHFCFHADIFFFCLTSPFYGQSSSAKKKKHRISNPSHPFYLLLVAGRFCYIYICVCLYVTRAKKTILFYIVVLCAGIGLSFSFFFCLIHLVCMHFVFLPNIHHHHPSQYVAVLRFLSFVCLSRLGFFLFLLYTYIAIYIVAFL